MNQLCVKPISEPKADFDFELKFSFSFSFSDGWFDSHFDSHSDSNLVESRARESNLNSDSHSMLPNEAAKFSLPKIYLKSCAKGKAGRNKLLD